MPENNNCTVTANQWADLATGLNRDTICDEVRLALTETYAAFAEGTGYYSRLLDELLQPLLIACHMAFCGRLKPQQQRYCWRIPSRPLGVLLL